MKKFTAFCLALILTLSFTVSAAAEDMVIAPAPTMSGKTVVLHTNDVHGSVEGYACVKALKAKYEAMGAEVVLADAGDYTQGTPYVSVGKGADAVTLMNAVGYDVVTIGNHEFDYGTAQLKSNLGKAEFKVVCSDVFDADGHTLFDANYTYVTKSGVKLGFFGLETPEAQTKANPTLIPGLSFKMGTAFYQCAQDQVNALRDADVVICLAHLGVDSATKPHTSYDLYANVKGIDFIIDGHSHTVMEKGANGEPIQSTGKSFANIGVIVIDNATKKIESNKLIPVTEDMEKDATVAKLTTELMSRIDKDYNVKFATSRVTLNGEKAPKGNRDGESNNGDLVADAMLWTILKDKGSVTVDEDHVAAVLNGGSIRAAIKPGNVTKSDINTVLPFGNTVTVVYVTGSELLEALEASTFCTPEPVGGFPQVSGLDYTINTYKAYNAQAATYPGSTYYGPKTIERVTINSVNGKAFHANDTYAVVTNDFCAAGGDTYYAFASAKNKFDTGIPLDEAVIDYVKTELSGVIGKEYEEPQGRIHLWTLADVVPGSTFAEAITYVMDKGYFNGTSATTYAPSRNVTRGQFVAVLYRMAGSPEASAENGFADVKADAYYAKAVTWASENGIVGGFNATTFGPDRNITRAQLAAMLYRFAKYSKADVSVGEDTNILSYGDVGTLNETFIPAVQWACGAGILNGTASGDLNHAGNATRAHAAAMLYRYCKAA